MGQNRFTKRGKYATGAHPHTVPGRVCKHDETLTFKGVIEQAFAGKRDERLPANTCSMTPINVRVSSCLHTLPGTVP